MTAKSIFLAVAVHAALIGLLFFSFNVTNPFKVGSDKEVQETPVQARIVNEADIEKEVQRIKDAEAEKKRIAEEEVANRMNRFASRRKRRPRNLRLSASSSDSKSSANARKTWPLSPRRSVSSSRSA